VHFTKLVAKVKQSVKLIMNLNLLNQIPLFAGLSTDDLTQLAAICQERTAAPQEQLIVQNSIGQEMFIIASGSAEVYIQGLDNERVIVVLGKGQIFGEMALIDQGYRSASVRAGNSGCAVYLVNSQAFNNLCATNLHIGHTVMRNLAKDLAFKLRHQNLAQM
jgi:CRP/FNR family transcriptional regulator, cyclic AMP receptor protein